MNFTGVNIIKELILNAVRCSEMHPKKLMQHLIKGYVFVIGIAYAYYLLQTGSNLSKNIFSLTRKILEGRQVVHDEH
jgi:hypothetical protein